MIKKEYDNFVADNSAWLVPALAVLVIFQTVMLGNSLMAEKRLGSESRAVGKTEKVMPTPIKKEAQAVVSLKVNAPKASYKVGETVVVSLLVNPVGPITVGGMDVVLRFDQKLMSITKTVIPKVFAWSKENRQKENQLALTFLEEKAAGISIAKLVKVADLTVKLKSAGEYELSFVTAERGATTVVTGINGDSYPITTSGVTFNVVK